MKIAIIREDKSPPDSRVPLIPAQVKELINQGYSIEVQRSAVRCFKDAEYEALNIPMISEITDQDILLGVKEVPKKNIIQGKTYFMFSHTFKEQPYNRELLKTIIKNKSRLIDYEALTDDNGARVIAFGKFAGMVGAHNGLYTYGKRTGSFSLPRMKDVDDYAAAQAIYKDLKLPALKIVLTGTGRVSGGAAKVLEDMGIKKVQPISFVRNKFDYPVYTQLNSFFYAKRKDGQTLDSVHDFYNNPEAYESDFEHFWPVSDIMINGIYWNPKAPAYFTLDQMKSPDFNLKVIADITCDIAPEASIPATLKASTIADPIFGFNPITSQEDKPFSDHVIDMMTIDNLPNELPKDASTAFGEMFMKFVLPELDVEDSPLIARATITYEGKLGDNFKYLKDYAGL